MVNLGAKRMVGQLAVALLLITGKALAAPSFEVNASSADAAFNQGRYQSAIAQYQRLLRARPDDAEYLIMLAKSYEITGDLKMARQYASEVLRHHSKNDGALLIMARIHGRELDWASAKSYYRQAVEANKNNAMAQLGLSQALIELGEIDAAETAIAEYRRLTGISGP